ncbi:MAG: hypothetical protein AAFQ80_24450, partial [Cyanobacteria bacterium J06621_8]
ISDLLFSSSTYSCKRSNIVDGLCNYFDDDYNQLKGIKEFEILNQYSYQGYVFENPGKSCPKVHESYSELWAYTHQHTNY